MPPSLVFTITDFEIGLFQAPERQCPSVERVHVWKTFQELHPPQVFQLNDSLVSRYTDRKTANRLQVLISHSGMFFLIYLLVTFKVERCNS